MRTDLFNPVVTLISGREMHRANWLLTMPAARRYSGKEIADEPYRRCRWHDHGSESLNTPSCVKVCLTGSCSL
jgi:hypothetical protein